MSFVSQIAAKTEKVIANIHVTEKIIYQGFIFKFYTACGLSLRTLPLRMCQITYS